MTYKVSLTARAKADASEAFERIRDVSPHGADRGLRGFFAAVLSLADLPARCPLTPEAEELRHPARHLLYGKRSAVYRLIFDIQEESKEGPRVRVLRIWHGSRDAISAEDLETAH
jgi:plasmid stabilization system protein ParE